ncbi:PEPxxWA-CTERM sorting domain-containing protein [Sphingomonas beigongshangi]|uniref:PEPxxWA-CTERM sorting domain-containing protein n=1 Tax=Sphingomonas beigongshangi TaxID=2782540 RepID=UPI001EEED5C5|nr:PEPxxWA-CTERM sorting domain-containing protein [Sphingomonas beigongshangi]
MRLALLAIAGAALVAAAPASAATIVQTDSEAQMRGLLKFDTRLGTLDSVNLKIDINKSNYNYIYSDSAPSGTYLVNYALNGLWQVTNALTGTLTVPVSAIGAATVVTQNFGGRAFGDFGINNITGSQTFSLLASGFNGDYSVPGFNFNNVIIFDGSYRGAYDTSDTMFGLPAGFNVGRYSGACTAPRSAPEDTCGSASYTLTYNYTPFAAAVPEPATWALMILGMGAVGFAMRRRKPRLKASFA